MDNHSPMDKEEYAYPSNLTSDVINMSDVVESLDIHSSKSSIISKNTSQSSPSSSSFMSNSTSKASEKFESNLLKIDGLSEGDDMVFKGHSRENNPSSGSDLIQVTVEDLLISEELDRTIKATKSNRKPAIQQQEQEQEQKQEKNKKQIVEPIDTTSVKSAHSSSTSPISASSAKATTVITATIRSTGERARSIIFDGDASEHESLKRHQDGSDDTKPKQKTPPQTKKATRPVAPKILTPAQQRELQVDEHIQKAIELHENNQLEDATHYFKLAAQFENPLGQLMYGLSLRHGWGCKPNPTEAIIYLQRAAEYAMGEMNELNPIVPSPQTQRLLQSQNQSTSPPLSPNNEQGKNGSLEAEYSESAKPAPHQTLRRMGSMDRKEAMTMARKELVMALYELGISYQKGWGVAKDKSVGFTYFKIAADLGDADSQNETALCYYEGIGVDKDMFESARYYRMAASQGTTQLGNSWIWKPKYDQYCAAENAGAIAGAGIKKSQDRSKRFTTAIQTAIHGNSTGKNLLSPPISPTTSISNQSISSIASGIASVTVTTASAIASPSSSTIIRQSAVSPPMTPLASLSIPGPSSRLRSSSSASASTTSSVSSPVSPISPTGSASLMAISNPSLAVPTAISGDTDKKKSRWTMWGPLRTTTSGTSSSITTTP